MDYDYYDESRTRLQLQSGPLSGESEEKRTINLFEVGACCFLALLCASFAWYLQGFPQFILLWLASALFVGPFAPPSATGGSCRVGKGELLPPEQEDVPSEPEILNERNPKQRRKALSLAAQEPVLLKENDNVGKQANHALDQVGGNGMLINEETGNADESDGSSSANDEVFDYDNDAYHKKGVCETPSAYSNQDASKRDAEWTPADIDLLKKLMVRYPRGMLKRWEVIAESFDGSHSVESIVKTSKTLGEKKKGADDSYLEFLAKRKGQGSEITSPPSQRWDVHNSQIQNPKSAEADEDVFHGDHDLSKVVDEVTPGQAKKKSEWTESEDKALLSALKSFPRDTPMRWEKVALAVPSRTKQQCFRRYTQLKEGFRSKLENT